MSFSDPKSLAPEEPPRGDTIFIADASVEGEELASLLRVRGYQVVDVPVALLDGHLLTTSPCVLVLDVDQPGAVALGERALASPSASRLVLFCVGDPLRAAEVFRGHRDDLPGLGENAFERPVDIVRLLERISAVATPSGGDYVARGTTPPPMYARHSILPSVSDSSPPASEIAAPGDPLDLEAVLPGLEDGLGLADADALSPDLRAILEAADARVAASAEKAGAGPPSSDEDADCPVPAEMLAPLDEPLDALDDSPGTGSGVEGGSQAGVMGGLASGLGTQGAFGSPSAPPLHALSDGASPGTSPGSTTSQLSLARAVLRAGESPGSYDALPPSTNTAVPSAAGYPFSMVGSSATVAGAPNSEVLALRRELGALGQRSPAAMSVEYPATGAGDDEDDRTGEGRADEAPVRFQEARPVGEGRSAMARAHEDHLRGEPPPPVRVGETARPPGSIGTNVGTSAGVLLEGRGGATSVASGSVRDSPRDLGSVSSSAGSASWTSRQGRVPPSTTDTSPRPRSGTAPLEPMRYPPAPKAMPATDSARSRDALDATRTPITAGSGKSGSEPGLPIVYGELEGARPLGRAISTRFTGAIVLAASGTARRVILHDGDVVTAASDRAEESLVGFLSERGDIDREVSPKLQARLPPSGRHAGAALIAQGYLAQDDLWPVLRAHAEWVIGKAIADGPGAVEVDDDPPARLKAEPSVFGGATGAEVFVETVRRVVPAAIALGHLGGYGARLDRGPRGTLLGECALPEAEDAMVRAAPGRTVGEVCGESEGDLATVIWAVVELGVLGVLAAPRASERRDAPEVDPIDDEAIRSKVRVRVGLVKEGDYFSLLGVPRSATAYEIKRAYLELRRAFEPSRLLTAKTVDLLDDVELVIEVIDEAYDILRDTNRRERYRRAIEASPMA